MKAYQSSIVCALHLITIKKTTNLWKNGSRVLCIDENIVVKKAAALKSVVEFKVADVGGRLGLNRLGLSSESGLAK